jgi:hypothetical protein
MDREAQLSLKPRRPTTNLERAGQQELSSKTVESTSLSLQGVNDVHSCDSLPPRVFSVRDRIPNNVLEEDLKYSSALFVDQTRNSLHTTSSRQTTDGRLGDTLDRISNNFSVSLGSSLSETFATFSSSSHC